MHPPFAVFKAYHGGFWYQHKNTFSNLNIFSSMMSVEDMVTRTSGGEDCYGPGDYLRYDRQPNIILITNMNYISVGMICNGM